MRIFAETALLPGGWRRHVAVEVGADGRIAAAAAGAAPRPGDEPAGILLPAPANVHSHAFQRAMSGLSEHRSPDRGRDTFWTWRELMFRFLDRMTPDHVEAIAAFVQMEMLEAGYGASVEFHYLHHAPDGRPYDDLAEMSGRVVAAAARSGIGLTLLPVLYRHGGCDRRPLTAGQARFGNDPDRFERLWEGARDVLAALPPDAAIGVAPHSLRAVDPEALARLVAAHPEGPVHMHLAEQVAEVEEVRAALGARPAEWLLANAGPDARWCLIHCTQLEPHETLALARTGAVAGLCPITEANLGDGTFDAVRWLGAGGRIAVGSDSNVRVALAEELRMLEYSQRLRDRSRAVLADADRSTGRRLFDAACEGGAVAAGREGGAIAPGRLADLVALDAGAVDLAGREGDAILDTWIFGSDDRLVREVWSAGRHVVREGRHRARAEIAAAYRAATLRLTA